MNRPQHVHNSPRRQQGLATLVVVMVLFFIVSLVAAYTSRNMIFEQKTSANQYRSTQAMAAAESGVDWALAMLNGGRIDDDCDFDAAARSFRERYLDFEVVAGRETGALLVNPDHTGNLPTCVIEGTTMTCKCPFDANLDPAAVGAGPQSAFRVRLLQNNPTRPGVVRVRARGCTRLDVANDGCLDLDHGRAATGDGLAEVTVLAALRSGLATPPSAAVTARQNVTPGALGALRVINRDPQTNGITVDAGGAAVPALILAESLPGTPGESSVVGGDSALSTLETVVAGGLSANERMFVSQFGMSRQTYAQQPGLRSCPTPPAGNCTAADINALLAQNPGRIVWVAGNLSLDADVGTPAAPALLVIDGDTLTLSAGVHITGYVYLTGGLAANPVTINLPDASTDITGALVSENSLVTVSAGGASQLTVTYEPAVLNTLRTTYGSFVRVPGSWKDWN
ncbi:MAG: pilus assembly PilX N-terminal domain-containing protein [Betaproteobacteria bacterium]|nr:pilus assembly PilX N-terminal domain-containing protein [Betaproteobacteria bacterium]